MFHVSTGHLQPPRGHSIAFIRFYARRREEAADGSLLDLSSDVRKKMANVTPNVWHLPDTCLMRSI